MRVPRLISPRDNELILYNTLKRVTGVPAQLGHAGEFLYTDGTNASWMALTGGGDMLAANNLSDVANASTSLTNLGGLAVANNLSDVADAATSNLNLGNSHSTYVPTFTATGGETSTCVCLGNAFVIQIDTDSISFTMQLLITMDGAETDASFNFNLPTGLLPYNNFAAGTDITPIMGLPNSGSWTTLLDQAVTVMADVGTKTGIITVHSPVLELIKLPLFIRYHR